MNSNELRAERERRGLTQAGMAEFLRVPESTYIKWENPKGRKKPLPALLEDRLKDPGEMDFSGLTIQEIAQLDQIARTRNTTIAELMGEFIRDGMNRAKGVIPLLLFGIIFCQIVGQILHPDHREGRRVSSRRRSESGEVFTFDADAVEA